LTVQVFKRHAIIFKENDHANDFFIVKNGFFKIMKHITLNQENMNQIEFMERNNRKFKRVDVCILGPGETFGEEDLLNGSQREIMAICESESGTLYKITKQVFIYKKNI